MTGRLPPRQPPRSHPTTERPRATESGTKQRPGTTESGATQPPGGTQPPGATRPRRAPRGGADPSVDPTVTPLHGAGERGRAERGTGRAGAGAGAAPLRGISDARRYTPRGRSIREADTTHQVGTARRPRGADAGDRRTGQPDPPGARSPRRSGGADPFRPALQIISGGADTVRPAPGGRTGTGAAGPAGATGRTGRRVRQPERPVRRRDRPVRRPARKPRPAIRLGEPKRRLRLATVLALAIFLVIAGRLVQIQLTDAKAYAARGLRDRLQTVPLSAPRGAIYDRDGNVLAHSVEARYAYADPGLVQDPERTADGLSPLLGVARSELLPKLTPHRYADGTAVRFEYLARGLDITVGEQIKALNLAGIGVAPDEKREVPGHDLAANVLGFTGRDLTGLTGIEAGYDELLRGVEGERTFEIGNGDLAAEIPGGYRLEKQARPGTSVRLTIDRDLQYEVQNILFQRMRQVSASFGSAVVLDVRTGEVLAQASYPGFDAAEPLKSGPEQRGDANTDIVVDPGSVAKVITVSAALQEGVVNPASTVTVGPSVTKGDTTYRDTHPFPAGTRITLPALLAFSSNVGTIALADQLGPPRLYQYQSRYGLGQPTGEGLPGESGGLIQPPENWSGSSRGSIPIGNGISVTPLQMAAVYATIANGGVWVQPHLVGATVLPSGKVVPTAPAAHRRVISAESAAAVRTMLEAVVTVDGATGRRAAIPGYRVAGKTGTGLRVANGRYLPGEVASFVGMAPADAPRYVVAVFAHTPAGNGGDVSAPAFRDMMAFTLGRFQVPPTGSTSPTFALTG